ncbi:N-acetyltransferase [uncultured Methanobrevibacter sp.]|uniref:N-acetyltransferase n=2 Tax=uncultured Methanobrevibacter sp. TaxID=253161 RepID=UPI0025ED0445|nr:N-acetyltransferase [uncultured Methanobrevibacter sp.]
MKNLNEDHNLDDFECESKDLTNFLKKDALIQQDMNLNLTHLVICDGTVVGYVSILTDTMKLKILEDKETKDKILGKLNISENNVMPAIKIGRFAIDKRYAHKGLGNHVFRNVLLSILDISQNIVGLRFITVDAYASAFGFYVDKNKFKYLKNDQKYVDDIDTIIKKDPERSFSLYKDIKSI